MAQQHAHPREGSTIETLQSLVVAFVLAMTFRGFVTEGFVIPTGSMAPTLMGQHLQLHSEQTGVTYPVDYRPQANRRPRVLPVFDPVLGRLWPLKPVDTATRRARMGDRILVFKCLYPFSEPDRFDVVVFKNPTDPDGEAENYIKRLVGLPDEAIWLVDGDVFVAPEAQYDDLAAYEIQRKPEHVQRAVWRLVHRSGNRPIDPQRLEEQAGRPWHAPWQGEGWLTDGQRSYRCGTADPTTLSWDSDIVPLDDWTPYNMISRHVSREYYEVSDLRVSAGIVADEAGLSTTFELEARQHLFEFELADGRATMRMRPTEGSGPTVEQTVQIDMPQPGRVFNVEFWHVDQAMSIFIDGKRAGEPLLYDWKPVERVRSAYGVQSLDLWKEELPAIGAIEPRLRWRFEGSPVTLHDARVDRDLYYRPARLRTGNRGPAYGTHPDNVARLGPDQFFMLGDNSPASSDSRLWEDPHPLVAYQIDDSPFLVNRKLLLGKAWVVYFPAPLPLHEGGRGWVPDFGRLRFIR